MIVDRISKWNKESLEWFNRTFSFKSTAPLIIILILVNFGIFGYLNTRPIHWMNDEMPCYNFYWSMVDYNNLSLHSGIDSNDLIKPFISRYNDGAFRTRQVSYFFEMLSFKFWQSLEIGFFRNYTLIILHLINVILLWFIVYRISDNKWTAWFTALLLLNSGISTATLLFPFRITKLLMVTFFLCNFLVIFKLDRNLIVSRRRCLIVFFILFVFSCLTDEIFIFLIPIYFIFIKIYKNYNILNNIRFLKYLLISFIGLIIFLLFVYHFSEHVASSIKTWHNNYILNFLSYFKSPRTIFDNSNAFLCYFLRRNFGYWDFSFWGILAFISFMIMFASIAMGLEKSREILFPLSLLLIIIIKSFLMPHMSIHQFIMPKNTFFPSMFFFSYYYVYSDDVLIIFCMGLLLKNFLLDIKNFFLMLCCITIISISNMVHWTENINDALKFHHLNNEYREKIIDDVSYTRSIFIKNYNSPIYLSFPAGSSEFVDGRFGSNKYWPFYPAYLLTMFLPSFERGELITSLGNVHPNKPFSSPYELVNAKWLLDVPTHEFFNLSSIKQANNNNDLIPKYFRGDKWFKLNVLTVTGAKSHFVFFIKGESEIILQINDKQIPFIQTYGNSYQIFDFYISKAKNSDIINSVLNIHPNNDKKEVTLVGPFIYQW